MTHYSATSLEQIAESLPDVLRAEGYWHLEVLLTSDGGHEMTVRTREGYEAMHRNTRLADPAMEAMVKALEWIAANYENGHINHVDFRVEAKHRADEALLAKDNGHV